MSQAKVAGPLLGRASRNPEFRGCLRRRFPDHLKSKHLDPRVARISSDVSSPVSRGCLTRNRPPPLPPPPLPFSPPPPRLLPRCYSPACSPRRGLRRPAPPRPPPRPPPASPCV
eukprot:3497535-Pyramimonas_sp.AAC.1